VQYGIENVDERDVGPRALVESMAHKKKGLVSDVLPFVSLGNPHSMSWTCRLKYRCGLSVRLASVEARPGDSLMHIWEAREGGGKQIRVSSAKFGCKSRRRAASPARASISSRRAPILSEDDQSCFTLHRQ